MESIGAAQFIKDRNSGNVKNPYLPESAEWFGYNKMREQLEGC